METKPTLTAALVAKITGCARQDIERLLPHVVAALKEQGIYTRTCLIAAIATITVECHWKLVEEAWFVKPESRRMAYFDGTKYGKRQPNGHRYYGRGIIQLTWDYNYRQYGEWLGIDLYNHPELALDPHTSARILALYFKNKKVNVASGQGDWKKCRKLVNGGYNGLPEFMAVIEKAIAEKWDI